MPKDGIYQITNVHTKQALGIGADADSGSELKLRDRITTWSEFRVEGQGGRKYTLVAVHNGMSARISDKKDVPVVSKSPFTLHLIPVSSPLKQYRISDRPERTYVVAKKRSNGRYKAALTSQRKSDDRQYWKFSYQRSLPNKGGGKGKGGGGKNKGGGGIKDGGKGKGGAVIKPKPTPTPKPQVDPATQQLIDANNQLLQQVAANNAWQQQMISALVGRLIGGFGPGYGGGGGGYGPPGGGYIGGGGGYSPGGSPPASPSPDNSRPASPDPGDDSGDDGALGGGGGGVPPKPKPKKKTGTGGKKPAGGKKKAGGKGKKKAGKRTNLTS